MSNQCKRDLQTSLDPTDLLLVRQPNDCIHNEISFEDFEKAINLGNITIPIPGEFDVFVRTIGPNDVTGPLTVDLVTIWNNQIFSDPTSDLIIESDQILRLLGGGGVELLNTLGQPIVTVDDEAPFDVQIQGDVNLVGTGVDFYINGVPLNLTGFQENILWQDDGVDIGSAGDIKIIDLITPIQVTQTAVDKIEITSTGGGGSDPTYPITNLTATGLVIDLIPTPTGSRSHYGLFRVESTDTLEFKGGLPDLSTIVDGSILIVKRVDFFKNVKGELVAFAGNTIEGDSTLRLPRRTSFTLIANTTSLDWEVV